MKIDLQALSLMTANNLINHNLNNLLMGKLKSGLFGSFTGKVGNAVGSSWKGINTIHVIPANHTDANSTEQQSQRQKMQLISSFLSSIKNVIVKGFSASDRRITPLNNAVKYNIQQAVTGEYPDFHINYEKLILSRGRLLKIFNVSVSSDSPGTITFNWTNNTNNDNAFGDDTLHLCIIEEQTGKTHIPTETIYRQQETCVITLPHEWYGNTVYVTGFMVKKQVLIPKKIDEVSNSWVMGKVVVGTVGS